MVTILYCFRNWKSVYPQQLANYCAYMMKSDGWKWVDYPCNDPEPFICSMPVPQGQGNVLK